ncbi:hypothetical protein, partial [Kosakonia cowanii]|uniref:hypothetical protein n=1 Tax=Kosakonia cowanii TaxID=208223 RepID=UPI00289E537A
MKPLERRRPDKRLRAIRHYLRGTIAGWRLRLIRPTVMQPLKRRRPDKRLRAIRHYLRGTIAGWRLRLIRPTVMQPLERGRPDKRLRAIRHYHRGTIAGWRLRLIRPTGMKPLKRRRPDKRYAPSGIITAAQLPDGGCALSGLPKRAYSHTDIAFTSGLAATVLTPAEIGEPKR